MIFKHLLLKNIIINTISEFRGFILAKYFEDQTKYCQVMQDNNGHWN